MKLGRRLLLLTVLAVLLLTIGQARGETARAMATWLPAAAPTPGPGAMSVYAVSNANASPISVQHDFVDKTGTTVYTFTSSVPAQATAEYHVRDMDKVPSPFDGAVTLSADLSFTAQVTSYDYPTSSPTPTATSTAVPTSTPTKTPTPPSASTATPTLRPTSTVTNTPSRTPTPLPTATSTPGQPGSQTTATFQVSAGADDVNEDGTFFDSTSSNIWIGNGESATISYAGLRFSNVSIPPNATISSAHLEVYATQDTWVSLALTMAADASGNSVPFSATSRPSQRTLGANSVVHQSDVRWTAGTWSSFDDISVVVQETVSRSDWQSGNSLSLVLKGVGSAWGRKLVASYEGSAAYAPRLVVTYQGSTSVTPTPTQTNTPTRTPTTAPSPTNTPTPTATATNTPTPTDTVTSTPTATKTSTPTATNTPTPTNTSTPIPTSTSTPTGTFTPTATSTSVPTRTPAPTSTATPPATATSLPTPTAAVGQYQAQYFNGKGFASQPVLSRVEPAPLSYDWGAESPASGVNADGFSARWTGSFDFASTGVYTFTATADDGIRVYLDGSATPIIDDWADHSATTYEANVKLLAGYHNVVIEYYEGTGTAVAKLDWRLSPCSEIAPDGQFCVQYYNNPTLAAPSAYTATEPAIDHDWGTGSPAAGVPADGFSARWTGAFDFGAGGPYTFTAMADDGVRVYVDDGLVLDGWFVQNPATYTATVSVASGRHIVRVEYFENDQGAVAKVNWAPVCPSGQYLAEYFANKTLTSPSALARCEAGPINYNWNTASPAAGVPADGFSARWTGTFTFSARTYTFTARTDDGVRVLVDGVVIIDQWKDRAPTSTNVKRAMSAGSHTITVEYYENTGSAVAQLSWK